MKKFMNLTEKQLHIFVIAVIVIAAATAAASNFFMSIPPIQDS